MRAEAIGVTVAVLAMGTAFCQQASLPKFRSVSITAAITEEEASQRGKEAIPTSISAGLTGRVRIRNASLRDCIAWAYDLPGYLIFENDQGFPDRYDIDATTPVGISANRYRELLQSLLADHFHFLAHREVRTTAAYALTLTEGGPQLHAAQKTGGKLRSGRGSLSGENVSMKELAGRLAVLTNRPVVDATSTTGGYSFTLTWRQPELKQRSAPVGGDSALGAFLAALEKQLGLKLVPQDSRIEMLVVDHAERPAAGTGEPGK